MSEKNESIEYSTAQSKVKEERDETMREKTVAMVVHSLLHILYVRELG